MIGIAEEMSEAAVRLALELQTAWLFDEDAFAEARAATTETLEGLGWDDIHVPDSRESYRDGFDELVAEIADLLADERARLGGDTVALPLFLLNVHAFPAALGLAFDGEVDEWRRVVLEACLADLWLDRDRLLEDLAREARWISVQGDGDDGVVGVRDLFRAAIGWLERVLNELGDDGDDQARAAALALGRELSDFQAEVREQGLRLAELVRAGDAEARAILEEVQTRLVEQGLSPQRAAQLTVDDPAGFWERLSRWGRSEQARDAAEDVLWIVLDFVPAGTGVKLGIKVARAVRGALKKKQRRR